MLFQSKLMTILNVSSMNITHAHSFLDVGENYTGELGYDGPL